MAKEEVSQSPPGVTAMIAVLAIMIILLAVLALIVRQPRCGASPWGLFTIACTIPIALLMGLVDEALAPRKSR